MFGGLRLGCFIRRENRRAETYNQPMPKMTINAILCLLAICRERITGRGSVAIKRSVKILSAPLVYQYLDFCQQCPWYSIRCDIAIRESWKTFGRRLHGEIPVSADRNACEDASQNSPKAIHCHDTKGYIDGDAHLLDSK